MTSVSESRRIYEAEDGDMLMALAGESLITRAASPFREPNYLAMVDKIRSADLAYTHAEMLFHNFETAPSHLSGGTYMRSDPQNIAELKWMGFDFVSTANNHAFDYGENGVLKNIENLRSHGMPFAGTGEHIAAARAPVYIDTHKGRIALLSGTTSGPPGVRAGEQRRDVRGRPGANFIRHTTEWEVDRATWDLVHQFSENLGFEEAKRRAEGGMFGPRPQDNDSEFHLTGLWPNYDSISHMKFKLSDKVYRHIVPNLDDLNAWLQRVDDARRMADWVVCVLHCHEAGNGGGDDPGEHATYIAKACLDAGADVWIGHGPHQDRGIEIYNGKPLFHSLGNFFLQNDTVLLQPHDNILRQGLDWEATPADFYETRQGGYEATRGQTVQPLRWESALAMVKWNKGKELEEIRMEPVDLGFERPRSMRGRPLLAGTEVANQVLDRFERLSKPFGTKIEREGTTGIIRP